MEEIDLTSLALGIMEWIYQQGWKADLTPFPRTPITSSAGFRISIVSPHRGNLDLYEDKIVFTQNPKLLTVSYTDPSLLDKIKELVENDYHGSYEKLNPNRSLHQNRK